ncbi:MAG: FHA domain-containing protein [Thiohalomonadaceae bacterium]
MAAFLELVSETGTERVPCGAALTLGRDRNNAVVLGDRLVSRNHAMVRRLGEADYYLIDSGSSNGTWVNGRRVSAPVQLHDGDRIRLGAVEVVFRQEAREAAPSDTLSMAATVVLPRPLIREVTLLVADMRGFTTLSEELSIQQLTLVMNRWFHDVSGIIAEQRGTLDKFIGDCVFARWESACPADDVIDALVTACRIARATAAMNAGLPALPAALRIGVGINTGFASVGVGNVNTALGDAVNTAFRLESASKALETDIVLGEKSHACLPQGLGMPAPRRIRVKGKREPVNVVTLTPGSRGPAGAPAALTALSFPCAQ